MKKLITALLILILSIVMATAAYAEGCQVVEGGGVPGCGLRALPVLLVHYWFAASAGPEHAVARFAPK